MLVPGKKIQEWYDRFTEWAEADAPEAARAAGLVVPSEGQLTIGEIEFEIIIDETTDPKTGKMVPGFATVMLGPFFEIEDDLTEEQLEDLDKAIRLAVTQTEELRDSGSADVREIWSDAPLRNTPG